MDVNPKNLNEFKRILKSLQNSNINLPELRELREEQEYLVKLKDQRQKIESLKGKFQEKDRQIRKLQMANTSLKKQLQVLESKYEKIEIRYLQDQQKCKVYQNNLKTFDFQRQKLRNKILQVEAQRDQFKKLLKTKELSFIDSEEQLKRKLKQSKDVFQLEKRKLIDLHEMQIKEIQECQNFKEQISQLEDLVQRQNRAMKLQEQSLIDTTNRNDHLESQIQSLKELYQKSMQNNNNLLTELQFYKTEAHNVSKKLKEIEQQEVSKREVQYLKLKMNELRRGEIETLENIVNQIRN